MSISLTDVSLVPKGNDNIYTTTANVSYKCSASINQESNYVDNQTDETKAGYIYYHSFDYSSLTFLWSFSDGSASSNQNGTHTFQNLNIGSKNTITASINIKATKTETIEIEYWYWQDDGKYEDQGYWDKIIIGYDEENLDPETGEPTPIYKEVWVEKLVWVPNLQLYVEYQDTQFISTELTAEGSASAIIYTRPGIFTLYNFSEDTIITSQAGLTAAKANAWCDHCGKYLAWKYQDNDKYDAADQYKIYLQSDGKYPFISADWFNNCAKIAETTINVEKDKTIINIDIFKSLGEAVSIE